MKIIRPTTIVDDLLESSDVPEVDNIGTSTTSLLIGTGSKSFGTQAGLGFVAGEWVKAASAANPANYMYGQVTSYSGTTLVVNVTVIGGSGTLADWNISYGWDGGATYAAGDRVQISTPNIHKIYESIAGANANHYPPTDLLLETPLWWREVSATNRWKTFDGKVGSQTSQAALISYSLAPGIIDSIALLNMEATGVTLTLTDPSEGEVYSAVIDLISTLGIIDAYTYFFEPIIRKTDIVKFDLPPYSEAVLDIAIANTGGTAKVGEIVVGMKRDIGNTLYSPSVGIVDYSQKAADDDGNYTIAEGPYSKKYSCSLRIPNTFFDELSRLLALYRATPLVWVALEEYSAFIAFGKFNDFTIELSGPIRSDCSLEIEGLT